VFLPELKGNRGEDSDAFRVCIVKVLSTNTTALMCTVTVQFAVLHVFRWHQN